MRIKVGVVGDERKQRRRRETEARRAARNPAVLAARKRRRNRMFAVGAALLLVLAVVLVIILVVGGDDDDAAAEPAGAISLEADEYSFDPDPALGLAGEIEVTMVNVGDIGHELIVLDQGVRISAASEFDESTEVGRIDSIAGGTEASTTVDLDAGTYQIVCLIGGHLESGMTSDLVVS